MHFFVHTQRGKGNVFLCLFVRSCFADDQTSNKKKKKEGKKSKERDKEGRRKRKSTTKKKRGAKWPDHFSFLITEKEGESGSQSAIQRKKGRGEKKQTSFGDEGEILEVFCQSIL